jgi:hypothetical protein
MLLFCFLGAEKSRGGPARCSGLPKQLPRRRLDAPAGGQGSPPANRQGVDFRDRGHERPKDIKKEHLNVETVLLRRGTNWTHARELNSGGLD